LAPSAIYGANVDPLLVKSSRKSGNFCIFQRVYTWKFKTAFPESFLIFMKPQCLIFSTKDMEDQDDTIGFVGFINSTEKLYTASELGLETYFKGLFFTLYAEGIRSVYAAQFGIEFGVQLSYLDLMVKGLPADAPKWLFKDMFTPFGEDAIETFKALSPRFLRIASDATLE
jgi:hypothetical protein